jgi:DNA-damage-inducible protein J
MNGGENMNKTSTVRARIEPDLKNKAEKVFQELGLTTTQAITLFYKQVELKNGLPFEVRFPNETTRRTLDQTDEEQGLVMSENAEDMFRKLGI